MGKASSACDADASTAFKTVFIDTSLDTHLAMIVSDVDTVSDLKKKIMYEHPLCFPDIGEIKIHAIKVKRKGYFYHLADSMLVKRAFDGVKTNWFLCADASSLVKHSGNWLSCNPVSGNFLACIANHPSSADGVDLLPEGPSQKLSIPDYSLAREAGSDQYVNQKVPDADQFSPGDSAREVSKNLEMEVKHISDDRCKTSSYISNKRSDPEIQEKYDLISGQNEMLRTHSERKEENSRNGKSDMQCSDYLEDALQIGTVARKKHKIRKKIKDAVDDSALKDNIASINASSKDASQQEAIISQNFPGDAGKEVSNDMKMGAKHISDDEPCKSSKEKDKAVDVQCNNLLGDASHSGPAAKKKRKIKNKNGVEDPLKEKEALICNSSNETPKPESTIPENSLEDKQNRTEASNDGLSAGPPQDVHLVGNSSSSQKRKKKSRSSGPYNEVVAAVSSSVKDVVEESSKGTVEFNHKDSGKESAAAVVPGRSSHGAKHSESRAISLKEKHNDPVQEGPCSSLDVDMSDVDAGNMESKGDASAVAGSSGISRTKSSKKRHATDAKGHPPLVVKESNNLDKDIRLSRHDSIVSDDHHMFETDLAHKIGQERELSQNSDPEAMLSEKCKPSSLDETRMNSKEVVTSSELADSNRIKEPGNFASKKKKSKKAKYSVGGTQERLGVEHAKISASGIFSTEPHKAFNTDCSTDEATKEESIMSQTEKNKVSNVIGHSPLVLKESNNLDKDIMLSKHDNSVSDDHTCGTDQAQKIGQERELSQNSNPEVMLSEKCKPSSLDETRMNNKEVVTSSEPGSFASKKKSSKKAKSLVGGTQVTLGVEHAKGSASGISSTEPHKAFNTDHSTDEATKEESILSQTEKNKVSKIKTVNTNLLGADREADEVSGNEMEPLPQTQINKTHEDRVHMDEKVRKKTKKKRSSTAENLPDVQMKEQDVSPKDLTPTGKTREVDAPYKMTRETRLVETNSKDHLNGSNLEPGKETGTEIESFHPQHISGTARSAQVQGRPPQANVDGNPHISGPSDEANKNVEVSICGSDSINFKDYFVPGQCQHEVVASAEALDDKVTKVKKSGREMKAKKNPKKLDFHSLGTELDLQHSIKSNDSQRSEKKIRGNSSTIHESLSRDESDELLPHSNSKSSKVSEKGVEARPSNDTDKFDSIHEESRNVVKASGTRSLAHADSKENIEAFVASSSSLGSSEGRVHKRQSRQDRYRMMARKASGNNMGKVVNSSNREKSLLVMSGNIFKDGSSESSEGDGVEGSDASTRTPSDDSSSSDHSEVENRANLDSPATGSYSTKRKDVGNKKSYSSGMKDVTMDTILRSSSRFKKAKLTASQSQHEDTESQPVDFVPDSQANL